MELAVGRYPLPLPSLMEIEEEMCLPAAGELPHRVGGNKAYQGKGSGLSHFALMTLICREVCV